METKSFNLFCLTACIFFFSSQLFAQEEFSSTQIKEFKNGIFEVITLKLEDNTVYKDDFPHDLIPFHIRNDKYYSVGTAFLVDDRTFVSAAHVFDIGLKSLTANNYALRDSDGNIFDIEQVQKYSNYRDFIQFSVKQSTKDYFTFDIASEYEAGDTIYAAGNALGEGVIFRKGTLTSFTYEPLNGAWKDIRFSAAASPGNSGGPLLNLKGEVVGIVTKKSDNENLNYAFPIKEFMAFSDKEAEFYDKQMGEFESNKRLLYTWDFKTPLPKAILTLRAEAETEFYKRFRTGRKEFEVKYGNDIFPKHENVPKYLKNQGSSSSLSIIDANGNDNWELYKGGNSRRVKITNNQSLWFSSNEKMPGNYQFFLEKPESMPLVDFVKNPKEVLDTFLVSVKWNLTIADTQVNIASYGEPVFTEQHTDIYGRVWQTALWNDTYGDQSLMTYCLPNPRGVVCDLMVTPSAWIHVQKGSYTDNLHRIMLSYSADIDEWMQFLSLPKAIIPSFLHDAKVSIEDSKVSLKLGEFSGSFDDMELSKDSSVYASVKIDPDNIEKLVVTYFSLTPKLNDDTFYSVSKFYDLKEDGSDNYTDFWTKFTTKTSPYDFSVVNEGELLSKKVNLGELGKTPLGVVNGSDGVGYLATCKVESKAGEEALNKTCDAFINGLNEL